MSRPSRFTLLAVVLAAGGYWLVESRPPVAADARTTPATLDLTAERIEERLVLRWDPSEPVLAMAREARVTVRDGARQTRFTLDRARLEAGRVEYEPTSSRVVFTFEAWGRTPLVATLTVIDPSLATNAHVMHTNTERTSRE